MQPLQDHEISLLYICGRIGWPNWHQEFWRLVWTPQTTESTVPVLASCAANGISCSAIHQVSERIQLQSLSSGLMSADTIHVCKQQRELRTMTSSTSDRYVDLGRATPTDCRRFPFWEICCPQIQQRFLRNGNRPSTWASQCRHQRWWRSSRNPWKSISTEKIAVPVVSQFVAQYGEASVLKDVSFINTCVTPSRTSLALSQDWSRRFPILINVYLI